MKKMAAWILILALCLQASAFAAETQTQDVKGTYVPTENPQTVYSVDITWGGMDFTYYAAGTGTWNPETHSYDVQTEAHWAEGAGTITLTNHSNAAVTAEASYAAKPGFETAGMTFSQNSLQVASADNGVDGAPGTAQTGTISVTPNGTLPENTTQTVIGTITVQVN